MKLERDIICGQTVLVWSYVADDDDDDDDDGNCETDAVADADVKVSWQQTPERWFTWTASRWQTTEACSR